MAAVAATKGCERGHRRRYHDGNAEAVSIAARGCSCLPEKEAPLICCTDRHHTLTQVPLDSKYKVDKQSLPYPDAVELASVVSAGKIARENFSEIEKSVGEIWASRIRNISADTIDLDDRFVDIGRTLHGWAGDPFRHSKMEEHRAVNEHTVPESTLRDLRQSLTPLWKLTCRMERRQIARRQRWITLSTGK